jgi:hypothetical protein
VVVLLLCMRGAQVSNRRVSGTTFEAIPARQIVRGALIASTELLDHQALRI